MPLRASAAIVPHAQFLIIRMRSDHKYACHATSLSPATTRGSSNAPDYRDDSTGSATIWIGIVASADAPLI